MPDTIKAAGSGPAAYRLDVQSGAQSGQVFLLGQGQNTVGRGADNRIRLDDPLVSKHHAIIHVQAEGVWVQDLGSSNGTFVSGRRIAQPTWLQLGDSLQIGTGVMLQLQTASGVTAPPMAPSQPPLSPPPYAAPPRSGGGAMWGLIGVLALLLLVLVAAAIALIWRRNNPQMPLPEASMLVPSFLLAKAAILGRSWRPDDLGDQTIPEIR